MKYMVAIPIPEPWLRLLIELKSRFRPSGWRDTLDPHITLLAPDQPLLPDDKAAAAFRAAAITSSSFNLVASRLGAFNRRHSRTLVIFPDPADQLAQLFESLLTTSSWQDTRASTKRQFEPHITLVNQIPLDQAALAQSELSGLNLQFQFLCDTIVLYAKQAHWRRWTELSRRRLGKEQHFDRQHQRESSK